MAAEPDCSSPSYSSPAVHLEHLECSRQPLVTLFHCGTKKQTEMANYALRNLGRNNADIGKAIQRQMKAYARWLPWPLRRKSQLTV